MLLSNRPSGLFHDHTYFDLEDFVPGRTVYLKLEGFNPAGSHKLKAALGMINSLEDDDLLKPGGGIIESSSGNLGIALALICAERGYRFVCVTDPKALKANINLIRMYGAEVMVVDQADSAGGFLAARFRYIQERMARDATLVWPNQYAHKANPRAHAAMTAAAIARDVPDLAVLVVGVGTSGTLMGCYSIFKNRNVQIVGVDALGSVTFGNPPGKRHIPGIGTSHRPELYDPDLPITRVEVSERETVLTCREVFSRYKLLIGGSTGSVLAGLRLAPALSPAAGKIVAIGPDFGERYLSTIYNNDWVRETGLCRPDEEWDDMY